MQGIIDCSSILQNMHKYASGEKSMMMSRVYFALTIPTKSQRFLFVDISQPYGTEFEEEPLEAGKPFLREVNELPTQPVTAPYSIPVYKGPYNHNEISDGLEDYYRSQIGQSGRGIKIDGGASNITMSHNKIVAPYKFTVTLEEYTAANPW